MRGAAGLDASSCGRGEAARCWPTDVRVGAVAFRLVAGPGLDASSHGATSGLVCGYDGLPAGCYGELAGRCGRIRASRGQIRFPGAEAPGGRVLCLLRAAGWPGPVRRWYPAGPTPPGAGSGGRTGSWCSAAYQGGGRVGVAAGGVRRPAAAPHLASGARCTAVWMQRLVARCLTSWWCGRLLCWCVFDAVVAWMALSCSLVERALMHPFLTAGKGENSAWLLASRRRWRPGVITFLEASSSVCRRNQLEHAWDESPGCYTPRSWHSRMSSPS